MSTTLSSTSSRPTGGLLATITFAAILVITTLGVGATAQASTTTCKTPWGSLPESATRTTTGHITGVRTGRHTCFDRFVIDLDGARSGYRIEYVDVLFADGSGELVPVKGGAIIRIIAQAPAYDDGAATVDPDQVSATNVARYRTFRDIEWAGSFEGQTTIGLGVRARLPFRTFALTGPGNGSRLVIDVAHRWTAAAPSAGKPSSDRPSDPIDTTAPTTSSTASTTTSDMSTTVPAGPTATVYYRLADSPDCGDVQAFVRGITDEVDPHRNVFQQLVAGPTAAETAAGAASFFSSDTADVVKSAVLNDGRLTVDFTDLRTLLPNASTSCGSEALLAQLNSTAFQFPQVDRTRYLIEGSCNDFANWLQRECFDTDRSGRQLDVTTDERASGAGCTPASTETPLECTI